MWILDFIIAETCSFPWKGVGCVHENRGKLCTQLNSYLLENYRKKDTVHTTLQTALPEPSLNCTVETPGLWSSSKYSELGNNTVKEFTAGWLSTCLACYWLHCNDVYLNFNCIYILNNLCIHTLSLSHWFLFLVVSYFIYFSRIVYMSATPPPQVCF